MVQLDIVRIQTSILRSSELSRVPDRQTRLVGTLDGLREVLTLGPAAPPPLGAAGVRLGRLLL